MSKKYCFIVSQIGIDGTLIREVANAVKNNIIKPAIESNYDFDRSDSQSYPGDIGKQIANSIITADLVVADVTPNIIKRRFSKPIIQFNANVIYEVGLRHALNLPIITICSKDYLDNYQLPFDLSKSRTIPFNLNATNDAIDSIKRMLTEIEKPNTFKIYSDFADVLYNEKGISIDHLLSGKFSHLISWELSSELEVNAKNVLAITHNLNWASQQIDKLIIDVQNHPSQSNYHCYILVDKDPSSNQNLDIMTKKISNVPGMEKHFEIRIISTAEYEQIRIDPFVKEIIPLHSDFVIYEKTTHPKITNGIEHTFLVISTSAVPPPAFISATSKKINYDVIIENASQVNTVYYWFKNMWNKIGDSRKTHTPPLSTFIDLI
ncbi:MAG: hypothetical protein JWN78_2005 [Bacteroidota bacterium]|nr:hypothetical protein [Bacteroidota bacterium]